MQIILILQIAYKDQNLSKVQSKGVFITRAVSVMQTGRTLGKEVSYCCLSL